MNEEMIQYILSTFDRDSIVMEDLARTISAIESGSIGLEDVYQILLQEIKILLDTREMQKNCKNILIGSMQHR